MILKNFCPFCLISGNLTVMTSENDPDDPLARFALARCESAFRTLVEQHTGMVHAVARRMLQGNEVQAREVTQTVFVELARRAATLPRGVVLGAWLHRVACSQAALLIRTEVRRRQREATAATMNEDVPDETAWAGIAPVIDAELERLPAADREALVLRFFENRPLRDVGTALGTTEEAARKRVTRALEKLRARFVRQGITTPGAAALAVLISGHSTQAAGQDLIAAATKAGLSAQASAVPGITVGAVAATLLKAAAVLGVASLSFTTGRASNVTRPPGLPAISLPLPVKVVKQEVPPPLPPSHLIALLAADDAMLARISRADASALAVLYDDWHNDLAPPLYDILCQRWVALDRTGALKHLRQLDKRGLDVFYAAWSQVDFSAALASAKEEAGPEKNDCVRAILAALLPQEVEKFLATAGAEKAAHVSAGSVELAMRTLAAGGVDKALAGFAKLTAAHLRAPAASALAALKADADPDEAIAWAKALPNKEEITAALLGAALSLVDRDPERVIPLLPLFPQKQTGQSPVLRVTRALIKRDAAHGLEWALENLPPQYLQSIPYMLRDAPSLPAVERLGFLRRFRARMVAEAAPGFSLTSFDESLAMEDTAGNATDPKAELDALLAAPPDQARNAMIGGIAWKMGGKDLPGLMKTLQELPQDVQAGLAAKAMMSYQGPLADLVPLLPLLKDGSEYAAQLFRKTSRYQSAESMQIFGDRIARLAPEERTAILAQVPPESRPGVLTGVAGSLANEDAAGALTWMESLQNSDQPAAAEGIATYLTWENAMVASRWIDQLQRGPVRDAATWGLCGELARSEPDSAWQWALSIGDASIRVKALGAVYYRWAKKGREQATEALNSSPLNAADRRVVQQFKP